MLKSLESNFAIMFSVPFTCWDYRDNLLLMSVQPNHRAIVLWTSSFTGSKYALYILPRALELYVKARTWSPCLSFWIFVYIDTKEARNSSSFSVSTTFHLGSMYQSHSMPLSLYPLIPYFQALDHSVTVGIMKNRLFIGTPSSVKNWKIFIKVWRSCLFQY